MFILYMDAWTWMIWGSGEQEALIKMQFRAVNYNHNGMMVLILDTRTVIVWGPRKLKESLAQWLYCVVNYLFSQDLAFRSFIMRHQADERCAISIWGCPGQYSILAGLDRDWIHQGIDLVVRKCRWFFLSPDDSVYIDNQVIVNASMCLCCVHIVWG